MVTPPRSTNAADEIRYSPCARPLQPELRLSISSSTSAPRSTTQADSSPVWEAKTRPSADSSRPIPQLPTPSSPMLQASQPTSWLWPDPARPDRRRQIRKPPSNYLRWRRLTGAWMTDKMSTDARYMFPKESGIDAGTIKPCGRRLNWDSFE